MATSGESAPDDGSARCVRARISRANLRRLICFYDLRHRRLANNQLATSALSSSYSILLACTPRRKPRTLLMLVNAPAYIR